MEKEQLNKVVYFTNIVSVLVVASCVIAIIMIGYNLVSSEVNVKKVDVNVNYKLEIDSTFTKESVKNPLFNFNEKITKNNEKIYREINKLINRFEEENKELLRQKQEQSKFVSLSSAILGILLAIAGFFGFKSIKEMKKDSIETSKETSEKTAEVVAKETAKTTAAITAEEVAKSEMREKYANINDEIRDTVLAEVKVFIDKKNIANIDDLKTELDNLKAQIDDCCNHINNEANNDGPEQQVKEITRSVDDSNQLFDDMFSDDDLEQ
jgi:cysteinyl-tRNA synthetase